METNKDKSENTSLAIFKLVDYKLGSKEMIDIRRMVTNLEQQCTTYGEKYSEGSENILHTGSRTDGFIFESSDMDFMMVFRGVRCVFSQSQSGLYDYKDTTVLMAENNDHTMSGHALLRLVVGKEYSDTFSTMHSVCVPYKSGYYVSNKLWKDEISDLLHVLYPHGPCSTGTFAGMNLDVATCLKSDMFPECAHNCIRRIRSSGWLATDVLKEIIQDGCYFVATASRMSSVEHLEWRMSFPLLEKRLVYAMNHVQFLCYGLLKILLKEAIETEPELKGLLCSYFLKTAVFWEIATAKVKWEKESFFECFWSCFQRIILWTKEGHCPNFIIPENNMFKGRIFGTARNNLLHHLSVLYQEGFRCLLRCPTMKVELDVLIDKPSMITKIKSHDELDFEIQFIIEITKRSPEESQQPVKIMRYLQGLGQIMKGTNAQLERTVLETWMNYLLQELSFASLSESNGSNKLDYRTSKSCMEILRRTQIDPGRHLLYMAVHYYQCGKYIDTIHICKKLKRRLNSQPLLCMSNLGADEYKMVGGGQKPAIEIMKQSCPWEVSFRLNTCIPELLAEYRASDDHSGDKLDMPHQVCCLFLMFHSYLRVGQNDKATSTLQELNQLVNTDDGKAIHQSVLAMSWDMLGICNQLNGENHAAIRCFKNAMAQDWCPFFEAVKERQSNLERGILDDLVFLLLNM